MVSDVISCLLNHLTDLWYIIIILHNFVETHLDYLSRIKMTTLSFILSELPSLKVNATMPSILYTVRNIFMRLYGSVEEVIPMCLV